MPAAGHPRWHYGTREHGHHLPEVQTGMSFDHEGQQSVYAQYGVEDEALSSRGSRKWGGAAVAVVVVVALSLGGMTLLKVLGGGGAQPEDVFPNSAVVFAKLDLNPSAGQKLAAYRLASKFSKVKDKVTSEDTSIKDSIFSSIFTGGASWGLDNKKDLEPWLGDRIGFGVFPAMDGDKKPEMALAIAFTDQNAAKAALDKAIAAAANKVETVRYAFADGYVIVSDTSAHATALVQAGKVSSLALPVWSTYGDDVKSLGSDVFGAASATGLGKVGGALYTGLIGGGDRVGARSMLSQLGIDSAEHVETLFGTETGVVVGGTIGHPEYAVRTRGSDPDAALAVARKALTAGQIPGLTVQKITDPDGILAVVGPSLTAAIVNGAGSKLGDNEAFRQVVPDLGSANFASYVNLAKLVPLLAKDNPKDAESLRPFSALGLTAAGGAAPSFRLRLSVR